MERPSRTAVLEETVRLESIGGHVVHVPVQVGASVRTRFILDTGIGLNLVSTELCARVGGRATGETYSGKRMSGQEVLTPLARVPSLALGSHRVDDALVGVFPPGLLPPDWGFVEGFLSPSFFANIPFTIRRAAGTLTLEGETPPEAKSEPRTVVPVIVRRSGPELTLFVELELPNGRRVTVEVDTGSSNLILDTRFMEELGVREETPGHRKAEEADETGYRYLRHLAPLRGRVFLRGAPNLAQIDPVVMFQKIIHDGLLGDDFLKSFDVTYDIAHSRLLFAPPSH
ncbi:MAG: pepsin/retropepsin-like aspartic protease family protein [Thermoplasmata archaeon]